MPSTTASSSQCDKYGEQLRAQVNKFYDERLAPLESKIKTETDAHRDPTKYVPMEGVTIDLLVVKKQMNERRSESISAANKKEADCKAGAPPDYVSDAQKVLDIATTIALLPFIKLFKSYKEVNVDLTEIYKGHPLGGDNALFPKARDDVLRELGISGDAEKILKDPWNQVVTKPAEAVGKAFQDIGKSLGIKW